MRDSIFILNSNRFPCCIPSFVVIAHNLIQMRDTAFAWSVAVLIVDANNRRFCFDFSSNHSFSFRRKKKSCNNSMNHHKQNYSNMGNSHTLNQHFESSGVAVLSSYYMYRILAHPPILGICRPVCGDRHRDISFLPTPPFYPAVRDFYGPLHYGVMAYPTCRCRSINVQVTALTFDLSNQ